MRRAVVLALLLGCSPAPGADAGSEPDAARPDAPPDAGCTELDDTLGSPTLDYGCDPAAGCPEGVRCTPRGACACPLGTEGPGCAACAPGYARDGAACRLPRDGSFDHWPNEVSRASSDPWIVAHHAEIRVLRPRVLALDFVNPADPARVRALLDQIVAGFAEGSRGQLAYELLPVRDLRDGAEGRPPPPADWPYENSTLYPRRPDAEPGAWRLDYPSFFEDAFAPLLGVEDPDAPGTLLPLCELVERGLVHELWIVGSGDVPDASAAEVLATSPVYTAQGNRVAGESEPCAGNGCFDPDVPFCGRTLRIGFVNYNRGPGCYLHSQGHGMESSGRRFAMPAWSEWWLPFARFDLAARHDLPFDDLYAVSCGEGPCLRWTSPRALEIRHGGATFAIDDFDPACGNVHFPPNGVSHYDYGNTASVDSSCARFAQPIACGTDRRSPVGAATWAAYEALAPDCGGAFLVWWFQQMPSHGSAHRFADGRPMPSVWPFLFY